MNTLFGWHRNPWRRFSRKWWMHWLDWKDLYWEIKCLWHRANYGYSSRDLWSLDSYLASWMPSAIQEFRRESSGYPMGINHNRWEKELKLMEYGWVACQHMNWDCDCFAEPGHDAYWKRRWDYCSKLFLKRFHNLWW
mgnify:CR=1 FL=1